MSTEIMEDPFATAEDFRAAPRAEIITAGRYRLPNRDGSPKKGGWQRVTNLCAAISDQFGLRVWEMEQIIIAFAARPELAETARAMLLRTVDMPKRERRSEVEKFLEVCKGVSGGNAGSVFGNNRHSIVEADHLLLPPPATDGYGRRHLSLYRTALDRNELRAVDGMQERRVLVEDLGAVGTLDNILEDLRTGGFHVGDLKTQKRFWTWLEIAAQLACYARAVAMWEPTDPAHPRAGRWVEMPAVSFETAFVLWMPREPATPEEAIGWTPHVDVYEVDIAAGWETAKLCYAVIQDRAGGKSKNAPRAWLRPARDVTLTETYAAKFAAVETREEGAALVKEAKSKGLWSEILAGEARAAAERLENSSKSGLATH
jgi:hypothetical protein